MSVVVVVVVVKKHLYSSKKNIHIFNFHKKHTMSKRKEIVQVIDDQEIEDLIQTLYENEFKPNFQTTEECKRPWTLLSIRYHEAPSVDVERCLTIISGIEDFKKHKTHEGSKDADVIEETPLRLSKTLQRITVDPWDTSHFDRSSRLSFCVFCGMCW